MEKRKLTEQEIGFMNKNMDRIEQETKDAAYMIKYCSLMLEEGIQINVDREVRKFEAQKRDAENAIEVNNNTVIEMKKQIEEGVEIKKEEVEQESAKEILADEEIKEE